MCHAQTYAHADQQNAQVLQLSECCGIIGLERFTHSVRNQEVDREHGHDDLQG